MGGRLPPRGVSPFGLSAHPWKGQHSGQESRHRVCQAASWHSCCRHISSLGWQEVCHIARWRDGFIFA